jgi:redox-sensitive bicupin YhaK (pirin superfamily)
MSTAPEFWDVTLPAGASFEQALPLAHHTYLYVFEGALEVGSGAAPLRARQGGVLGEGECVQVRAGRDGGRFLLLSAKPIGEPVVQHGPFVMNTREEIEQAIRDYQSGRLVAAG